MAQHFVSFVATWSVFQGASQTAWVARPFSTQSTQQGGPCYFPEGLIWFSWLLGEAKVEILLTDAGLLILGLQNNKPSGQLTVHPPCQLLHPWPSCSSHFGYLGWRRRHGRPLWILRHQEPELCALVCPMCMDHHQALPVNCFQTLLISSLFRDVGIKEHLSLVYHIRGSQLPLLLTNKRNTIFSVK